MKKSKQRFFVAYEDKPNHYLHYETTSYTRAERLVEHIRSMCSVRPFSTHITFVRFVDPTNFYVDFLPINAPQNV